MPIAVVHLVEVDAQRDGHVRILRGCRDHDLLRAGIKMLGCVLSISEQPGGLDHHVHSKVAPGQGGRIPLGDHLDVGAVDPQARARSLDLPGKAAENRVVLEQVGNRLRVNEVVYRQPLDLGTALV